MKVELHMYDYQRSSELCVEATLTDYGVVIRHPGSWDYQAEIEVVEGPEFENIKVTDEEDNQWRPTGAEPDFLLDRIEQKLQDWWYTEIEENRL